MATTIELLNTVLRLEGDRTVAICGLHQDDQAAGRLAAVTAQANAAIAELNSAGVQYPLHMLAGAADFAQEDYLFLQLAILGKLGTAIVSTATRYLGAESALVHLSHAIVLFERLGITTPDEGPDLRHSKACRENLVCLIASDDAADDPVLVPGPAVNELMGW